MQDQPCPRDEELASFGTRNLPGPRLDEIAEHLAGCTRCQERLAGLADASLDPVVRSEGQTGLGETLPQSHLRPVPFDPLGLVSAAGGYELLGEVGRGGMGVVYRALDRRRGRVVALKTLQGVDASQLYRFKQEFRNLAGVTHPNLVTLHELVSDGQVWFFTMEYIEGVDFLGYVRGQAALEPTDTLDAPATAIRLPDAPVDTGDRDPVGEVTPFPVRPLTSDQLTRLRAALRQLALGLDALHTAGKLHRDLKPGNVLVTPEGRVVILDFGLAAEMDRTGLHQSSAALIVGTVAYMSPEQADARPVSAASDWYSVGVMLYEALIGHTPFRGTLGQVLRDKQILDPSPPSVLLPNVPEDLDALCVGLLCRPPEGRPSGSEVLRRLGSVAPVSVSPGASGSTAREQPFVGRAAELATLAESFAALCRGRMVLAHVHGLSGAGKSALVQRFVDGLRTHPGVVILAGRCYEQETVPYKAFDSVVDGLSRHLARLPQTEAAALLPRDVSALVRLFPVLRQAPAVAHMPGRTAPGEPQELRRRALAALRELLARLGDRGPLVVAIDDLQWADTDSAALLAELLRPPDPPVLLLVAAYRSEQMDDSPFLVAMRGFEAEAGPGLDRQEVMVGDLNTSEARELALSLLGSTEGDNLQASKQAEAIARESGGSPLFVHELAGYVVSTGADVQASADQTRSGLLERVLWNRVEALPTAARRFLEMLAVAGVPLRQEEAARASGLAPADLSILNELRAGHLLRASGSTESDTVEPYHDRVRECVLAHLSPAVLCDYHRCLAETLESSREAEPEVLAAHLDGAGLTERAGQAYVRAADRAASALAFDQAASFYRRALSLLAPSPEDERSLRTRLGDALASAGRGGEAAPEYLLAAEGAPDLEALELRRQAADQYLMTGHMDEGIDVLQGVLARVGLTMPRTSASTILGIACRRLWLRLRGLGFRERRAEEIPPLELMRVDACVTAVRGLAMSDVVRSFYFQGRGLSLALRAGEPFRMALFLLMEVNQTSMAGSKAGRRQARLWESVSELMERLDRPYLRGLFIAARGLEGYLAGRWRAGLENLTRGEELLRENRVGVAWDVASVQIFRLMALLYLGEVAQLRREWPTAVQEARERGDRAAERHLSVLHLAMVRLAEDDVEGARRGLASITAGLSREEVLVEHYLSLLADVWVELYTGNAPAAWRIIEDRWSACAASLLRFMQKIRIELWALRVGAALALAVAGERPLLRTAERDIRRIEREQAPWGDALATLLRAGLAFRRANPEAARTLLTEAARQFDQTDMGLHAAATRRRLGQLLGEEEGGRLVAEADSWMTAQEVRNPARMTALLVPGFPDAGFLPGFRRLHPGL
jgi:eukaryotic-like serine/threonine-protein kinase